MIMLATTATIYLTSTNDRYSSLNKYSGPEVLFPDSESKIADLMVPSSFILREKRGREDERGSERQRESAREREGGSEGGRDTISNREKQEEGTLTSHCKNLPSLVYGAASPIMLELRNTTE